MPGSATNTGLRVKVSIDDVWPITGKRVLVRVDFNVPMVNGAITSDLRIRSAIPTIRRIVDQGGICILMSHLGRPKGVTIAEGMAERKHRQNPVQVIETRGKTAYFALLPGDAKLKVLSWSSAREKALAIGAEEGVGKTALFTYLPEEEKRSLLNRYLSESSEAMQQQANFCPGYDERYSLRPVAVRLAELLDQQVYFAHDCLDARAEVQRLKCGDVMLLENVRFYSEEGSNVEAEMLLMAKILASYGDVYVNDAFATAHRRSATMTGIPKILGHGAAGYLMEKEINYFATVLNSPQRPLVAIVGGAKVSDKVQLLENMLSRIDYLIIGGGMAYTFLKAQGHKIGKSLFESDRLELAQSLLKKAEEKGVAVYLPLDHVCNTEFKAVNQPLVTNGVDIPDGNMALDIGPKTIAVYVDVIANSKSAIWNGPMGVFEMAPYAAGTFAIAKAIAESSQRRGLLSLVGGGETASAVEESGDASKMTHVSTGGGASLELLEGKVLEAIALLDSKDEGS